MCFVVCSRQTLQAAEANTQLACQQRSKAKCWQGDVCLRRVEDNRGLECPFAESAYPGNGNGPPEQHLMMKRLQLHLGRSYTSRRSPSNNCSSTAAMRAIFL